MADISKLQASVDTFSADLSNKLAAVQRHLDSLSASSVPGSPEEQAKIDSITAQVDAADQLIKAFDPSAV